MGSSVSAMRDHGINVPYFCEATPVAPEDPIHLLCKKLSAFHISIHMQKIAEKEEYIRTHPPLPQPRAGERPCWEPPIFDYSWFEQYMEAEKEMSRRRGSKDIAFRREIHDLEIENKLLWLYSGWVAENARDAEGQGSKEDARFWRELKSEIGTDHTAAVAECSKVHERHGKTEEDLYEVKRAVLNIAVELHPKFREDGPRKRHYEELLC